MPRNNDKPGKGGGPKGDGDGGGSSYSSILIFGDSLSDNGNFNALAAEFFIEGYSVPFQYDGGDGSVRTYDEVSFTDGTAYADTLANLLSLEANYDNHAFGGAEALGSKTGDGYIVEYSAQPYTKLDGTQGVFSLVTDTNAALAAYGDFDINLAAQVTRYLDANPDGAPGGTLAVLNIGANDLGEFDPDIIAILFGGQVNEFASDIGIELEQQARRLAANGVDKIALYTLPVAEFFIGYDDLNFFEAPVARDLIDTVNDNVIFRAGVLNDDGISTELVRVDIMSEQLLVDMQTHGFLYQGPYLYGYSGDPDWVEQADGSIIPVFDVNPTAAQYRPEQILFFDEIHPSGALHDMLAVFSAETLSTEEVFGSGGNDRIRSGNRDDFVVARSGNDRIELRGGDDVALGGRGDDLIIGGSGSDLLIGGKGNDDLDGGSGQDLLAGSGGNDTLSGGGDSDLLIGGLGSDMVFGDGGDDVFIFFEEALWGGTGGQSDVYDGGDGSSDALHMFLTEASYLTLDNQSTTLDFGLATTDIETIEWHMGVSDLDADGALGLGGDLALRFDEAQLWGVV